MAARKKTAKSRQKGKRNKTKISRVKVSKQIRNRVKELQTKLEAALAKQVVQKEEVGTSTVDLVVEKPEPNGIAVSPLEYDCIINAFKNPRINNRHKILSLIHNHLVGLEVRFQKEIFELEDRYLKTYYAPLQTLRKALIEASSNGKQHYPYEKALVENCKSSFSDNLQKYTELQLRVERLLFSGHGEASKNCHDFWRVVFLHSDPILRDLIQPCDVDILKYLNDVRSEPVRLKASQQTVVCDEIMDSCDVAVGYDLFFDFRPNPYFSNSVLTKRYLIDVLPDQCDFILSSHDHVMSSDWLEVPVGSIEGMSFNKFPLSRSIFDQNHDVDKLLDYNGPQIIAVQGCQIRWTSKASFMKRKPSMVSCYDKQNGFSIKSTNSINLTAPNQQDFVMALKHNLRKESSPEFNSYYRDFSVDTFSSKEEKNIFTPSMGIANLSSHSSGLYSKSVGDKSYSCAFSKPRDANLPNFSHSSRLADPDHLTTSSLVKPNSKLNKTKNFLKDFKFNFFSPATSSSHKTSSHSAPPNGERTSSPAVSTETKSCPSRVDSNVQQYQFFGKSSFPKVTRGTNSISQTSLDNFVQPPMTAEQDSVTPADCPNQDYREVDANVAKSSVTKSFFNFFDIMWNKKAPDGCEEVAKDYQVGSYIRDVLIPRAYMFYRQKDLNKQDKDRRKRHVFTCLGNRYEKEFKVPTDPEIPSNYDEIDEDIPIAVTEQALTKIESCASLKKEILENNKETATRLANSFIGQMIRLRDDDATNEVDDDVSISTKKCCSTTFESKIDVDDAVVTSASRDSRSFFDDGSDVTAERLTPSSTNASLAAVFEAVSQSAEKNQTFVKNSFSVVGAEDLSQIDAPMEEKNESGSDLFKWCSYVKPDANMEVGDEEKKSEDVEMTRDFLQVEPTLNPFMSKEPMFSISNTDSKVDSEVASIIGDTQEVVEKPTPSNACPEIHLTTLYDSPASDTNLYQGTPNPYFVVQERKSDVKLMKPSFENKASIFDVTMKNTSDEANCQTRGNDVAEESDVPMTREQETFSPATTKQL